MNIIVREYQEGDEREFKQSIIDLQNLELAYAPDMISGEEAAEVWFKHINDENKRKGGRIYLAEVNGQAVGFISLRIEHKGEEILYPNTKCIYVTDFIVNHEFRGKGVGKLLMAKADEYAREKGISYVKLDVFAKNVNAYEVYKKLGFHVDEVTMLKKVGR